jgi:uncharacterized protein YndB with AHSA1/START domain
VLKRGQAPLGLLGPCRIDRSPSRFVKRLEQALGQFGAIGLGEPKRGPEDVIAISHHEPSIVRSTRTPQVLVLKGITVPTFKVSRTIAAPPERVFALFTNFEHAAENVTAIKRVELLTDGPIGVGTRFRETRAMFGGEATETMEVTGYDPPRSCTLGAESCGARWASTFRFAPVDGGTRVDAEIVITPVTFLAKLMSPLSKLMAGPMRKCIEGDMADLAQLAERDAAPAAA